MRFRTASFVLAAVMICFALTNTASAMYDPSTGRFLSRDPNGQTVGPHFMVTADPTQPGGRLVDRSNPIPAAQYADGMSLYQYVRGNPGKFADPSGKRIFIDPRQHMWAPVLNGFQKIIGDCAKLRLRPRWRTVTTSSTLLSVTLTEVQDVEVIAIDAKSNCPCNDCWKSLKSALDAPYDVVIGPIPATDDAYGYTGGSVRPVGINPKINVSLPEIDPETGGVIESPVPFEVALWHEAIGHAGLGLGHSRGAAYDPTIQEENRARACLRRLGYHIRDRVHIYYTW